MSRRNQLKVDTFPFLAVLLCAMGALILVLLVMDRRSKLAAQQRVADQLRSQNEKYAQISKQRRDELEAKRQAQQAAWNKKREALSAQVSVEEQALEGELREVQARLAAVAEKLRQQEQLVESLRDQLKQERARLASQETALNTAQDEARRLTEKLSDAEKARAKLAENLVQLEAALKAMLESRSREGQTYSLVPYAGKRGDNRRPIYVECTEAGVVFHPDKVKVDAPTLDTLRDEVRKRVANQAAELAAAGMVNVQPYLMLLVRPNGILRHYEMIAVAKELKLDFGYEFVDADWILNVPTGSASSQIAKDAYPSGVVPFRGSGSVGAEAGSGSGSGTGPEGSVVGHGGAPATLLSRQGGTSASGQSGVDLPAPNGSNGSGPALPNFNSHVQAAPLPSLPLPQTPSPNASAQGIQPPDRGTVATGRKPSGESVQPEQSGATGSGTGSSERPNKFANPSLSKPVPLRPARLHTDEDTMIYVECRADVVVVYPVRRQIGSESLNHTPLHNPLTQTVNQFIARRQAQARQGGSPARFHIRFLVHPDGERTLHQATHSLETVSVPKSRYTLMPDDDVQRLIAGY